MEGQEIGPCGGRLLERSLECALVGKWSASLLIACKFAYLWPGEEHYLQGEIISIHTNCSSICNKFSYSDGVLNKNKITQVKISILVSSLAFVLWSPAELVYELNHLLVMLVKSQWIWWVVECGYEAQCYRSNIYLKVNFTIDVILVCNGTCLWSNTIVVTVCIPYNIRN